MTTDHYQKLFYHSRKAGLLISLALGMLKGYVPLIRSKATHRYGPWSFKRCNIFVNMRAYRQTFMHYIGVQNRLMRHNRSINVTEGKTKESNRVPVSHSFNINTVYMKLGHV